MNIENKQACKKIPFSFTGTTREYFGIWIVNILLTVITLGVYSAWAKVRTNKYFYNNTLLDDSPFDYLANPIAILKGWAIAIVFFSLYSAIGSVAPVAQIIFTLIIFVLLPWLVVKALSFRLYNSSYRHIRFQFERAYGTAYKVFFGIGLLVPITLGLIIPSYVYRQKKFIVDNSRYGTSSFKFKAIESKFYEIYGIGILILALAGGTFALIQTLAISQFMGPETVATSNIDPAISNPSSIDPDMKNPDSSTPSTPSMPPTQTDPSTTPAPMKNPVPPLTMLLTIPGMMLVYLYFFAYINTRIHNIIWNSTHIADKFFSSTITVNQMAKLYLTNGIGIMLSFGLLIPWARIRMARYKITNLSLNSPTDLESFITDENKQVAAIGEEIGEVFDIDIGL